MSSSSNSSPESDKNTRYFNACFTVTVALIGAAGVVIAALISGRALRTITVVTATNTIQPTDTPSLSPTATFTSVFSYKPPLCGDLAYKVDFFDDGGIPKTNLIFEFPNGYTEGFFTSGPGVVEFSDGQVKAINTQFTLVTSGFSFIKMNGVAAREDPPSSGNWVPNSYGCLYFPEDAHLALSEASKDYQIYVDANIKSVLYRVTPNRFELLASNHPLIVATAKPTLATTGITTSPALITAFYEVDRQFQEVLRSNIAFNAPKSMKLDETVTVELLLNPSLSSEALATELIERSNLLTSTAEPSQLVTEQGGSVEVVTSEVDITDRMKATLKVQTQGAFEIQELHDNAEQPISSLDTTIWRWSITAKKPGKQTLELLIYRLIKYANQEYWREVETYRADITVNVTPSQWLTSLDWKWILGILATALLIPLFFRWYDNRKKEVDTQKESKPVRKKHSKFKIA